MRLGVDSIVEKSGPLRQEKIIPLPSRFFQLTRFFKKTKILLKHTKHRVFSVFTRPKKFLRIGTVFFILLLLIFQNYFYSRVGALSYDWVQQSWDASADSSAFAVHPTNKTGWTKYFSRDTTNTEIVGGDIKLKQIPGDTTRDTYTDFNDNKDPTSSNTQVLSGGSVTLQGTGTWGDRTALPSGVVVGVGGALTYDGANTIYAILGGATNSFYKYDINGNTWTLLSSTPFPQNVSDGGSLAYVPSRAASGPYVYGFRGSGTQGFYRYDVTSPGWAPMQNAPFAINDGGSLVYDGGQYLYALKGGLNGGYRFAKFDLDSLSWIELSDAPWTSVGGGGALAHGDSGKIYALRGRNLYNATYFSSGAWNIASTNLPPADLVEWGGALAFSTAENALFALVGNGTTKMRRYVNGTWGNSANFPANVVAGGSLVYAANKNMFFAFGGGDNKFYYYYAYPSSGSYISNAINLTSIKKLDRVNFTVQQPSGTTATVYVRAGDTASLSGPWTTVASGADISTLNGAGGGRQYVQYKVDFTTTNLQYTPTLDQIQFTYSSYATSGELVSSPYDTSDNSSAIGQIKWTEDTTLPLDTPIRVQVRTAATQAGLSPVSWNGPLGPPNPTESYYQSSDAGSCSKASGLVTCFIIPANLIDGSGDRWVQYRVILGSSGVNTPTLQDITLTYVINTAPSVSITNTPSKDISGTVRVEYSLSDQEETGPNAIQVLLFYDLGITVGGSGSMSASDTSVIINVPVGIANSIPSSGVIMIENEQINYTGRSGGQLTGLERGFNRTRPATHLINTPVWIKANSVTGDTGMLSVGSGKAIMWAPNSDIPGIYTVAAKVRVSANDQNAANQIGVADSTISGGVDTIPPQVGAAPIIINDGAPKTTAINVTLKFDASDAQGTLNMSISNDGVFDTEPTVPYNATAQWQLLSGDAVKAVYVQFKDASGNTTGTYSDTIVLDTTPPQTPSGLSISEGSNEATGDVILVLTWSALSPPPQDASGPDFLRYNIYRSPPPAGVTPDADGFGLLAQVLDVTNNAYADRICGGGTGGTCVGQTFSYKINAEDNANLVSTASLPVSGVPIGRVVDASPPVINKNSISQGTPGELYLPISWTADETPSTDKSDSRVAYVSGSVDDESWVSSFSTAPARVNTSLIANSATHRVNLVGLEPGQIYSFEARSQDQVGNMAKATSSASKTLTFPDINRSAPVISNITPVLYPKTATISWTTDKLATSLVEYNGVWYGNLQYAMAHTVTLPVTLQENTPLSYTIRSRDIYGNKSEEQRSLVTAPVATDSFQITENPTVNQLVRGATITWQTNKAASSYVEWGTEQTAEDKPIYNRIDGSRQLIADSGGVFAHSVTLANELVPSTMYYYRVRSVDGMGNEVISSAQVFTTLSETTPDTQVPTINNITVRGVGKNSFLVEWTTSEAANSTVEYSKDTPTYNLSRAVPRFRTSHAVEVSGIESGTLYYFRVRSQDPSGKTATNDNNGVGYLVGTIGSTALGGGSDTPLTISNVAVNTAENLTTISWTTSEQAYGFVEYGFDKQYRETYGQATAATAHQITLPADILGNVTYSFQIRARAADGREAVSQDIAVFTAPPSAATLLANDKIPPEITQVAIPVVTETTAVVQWITNEPAVAGDTLDRAGVNYGVTTLYGQKATTSPTAFNLTHSVTLNNLSEDTTYYFRISVLDQAKNLAREDRASPPAECQSNGTGCLSFTTKKSVTPGRTIVLGERADKDAPRISDVVVQASSTTAVISWNTNEDSNHFVEYGKKSGTLTSLSGDADEFVNEHKVTLENLTASTTYYFHAISYDTSGNKGVSEEQSFITLGSNPEEAALKELEKQLKEDADKQRLELLKKLSLLASSTQSIVTNFLDQLKLLSEEEQDKILEILFGEVVGPVRILRELPEVQVTDTTAIFSWDTIKETNSLVAYVVDNIYKPDTEDPYTTVSGNKDTFGKEHQVILTGLKPFTLYHYQLRSEEKSGKKSVSIDRTFKTHALKPEFESARISAKQERSATIQWTTTLSTDGVVELTNLKTKERTSQGDPNFKRQHELALLNLSPATKYQAVITASTEEGVVARSKAIVFTTGIDTKTTVISNIRTRLTLSSAEKNTAQAVITWETDEPSTSKIMYEKGLSKSDKFQESTAEQTDLVTFHVMVLTKLSSATIYRFKAISTDEAGNTSLSKEFKILTPKKEESVLELIIKNFEETFGFLVGR